MARLLIVLLMLLYIVPASAGEKKADKPLRVCLISGSAEYESDKSLASLQKTLEKEGMVCSRAFATSEDNLPGLENLDSCDVAVLFTRRLKLKGEQLERLKKYLLAGKPVVGIRTASHAVQTWLALDKEVFGGNYQGHFGEGPFAEVKFADVRRSDDPILKGVQPFRSAGSLYKNPGLSKDVTVLLTGAIPGHTEPVAWTRGQRVFYTSLGHQSDFADPNFVRLLVNAIRWTAEP